jgi:hypothetical protein
LPKKIKISGGDGSDKPEIPFKGASKSAEGKNEFCFWSDKPSVMFAFERGVPVDEHVVDAIQARVVSLTEGDCEIIAKVACGDSNIATALVRLSPTLLHTINLAFEKQLPIDNNVIRCVSWRSSPLTELELSTIKRIANCVPRQEALLVSQLISKNLSLDGLQQILQRLQHDKNANIWALIREASTTTAAQ